MIVSTSIDHSGVSITIDSDGDQGDCYSSEVLDDMLTRAGQHALKLWLAHTVDEGGE